MKKINVWCILVTVLFLLLGLSKATLASSQGKAKKRSRYGKTGENSSP